jgi:hypothetical protein
LHFLLSPFHRLIEQSDEDIIVQCTNPRQMNWRPFSFLSRSAAWIIRHSRDVECAAQQQQESLQ